MTKVGAIMAGLAILFGALAVRDIRTGAAGFVVATLCKRENPLPFWGLVIAEILAALLFAAGAMAAFTIPATCDEVNGVCTVTIHAQRPDQ
jgi:ornithine cyclodeaminase/alanine dehydrogenase-like protein (mu-crystallin family)